MPQACMTETMIDDCNCSRLGCIDDHSVGCPAGLYQSGIQRGCAEERARIVEWLRLAEGVDSQTEDAYDRAAHFIERGEHVRPRTGEEHEP